jgi:colicin import membrane protein
MGRIGITYDQVAAAADALVAENIQPTLKAVREKIGKGGMGTVHKYFQTWASNRPKSPAPTVELPAELVKSLSSWVMQSTTAARADSEERLVQSQAEAVELARAGEQLEAEHDDLLDDVSIITTERDHALATATERGSEIARLLKDVDRERLLAGAAQVEAAEAKFKVESQAAHLVDMRADVARLNESLRIEAQARIVAEKNAAVLESERDAARKDADQERARIEGMRVHLDRAHTDMESVRKIADVRLQSASTAAQAMIAAESVKTDRERETSRVALAENARLAIENATLKAQLDAVIKAQSDATLAAASNMKESDSNL